MTNVLIAFYSRGGVTETLAKGVAEGAEAEGATVRMRRARELVGSDVMRKVPGWSEEAERMNAEYEAPTEADAIWADAIVFGTPTRFGNVSSELKAYIDSLGGAWSKGQLNDKVGSAFTSTSSPHGGNESTIISLYNPIAHLGLVIVPVGYGEPTTFEAGTPYGASSVSENRSKPPSEADLTVAHYQGQRVAKVAAAMKAVREGRLTGRGQPATDRMHV